MTIDEAHLILNTKKDTPLQDLIAKYDHLLKVNDNTSHYLQSKVVRAKERIELEIHAEKTRQEQPKDGAETQSSEPRT